MLPILGHHILKEFAKYRLTPETLPLHQHFPEGLQWQEETVAEICSLLGKTVLSGGKRLRPLLTLLMADFFGIERESVIPFAQAIEKVHAASLGHDDVVDEALIRRNEKTLNVVVGNKKAVLAGDYLLASVIVDVCNLGHQELLKELSLVIQKLAIGEWLQVELALKRRPANFENIQQVALNKTASVIRWCSLVAPHLLTENHPEKKSLIDLCGEFGSLLGVSFQMIDDALDESDESGKASHIDEKNGLYNFISWAKDKGQAPELAVEEIRGLAAKKIVKAQEILDEMDQILGARSKISANAKKSLIELLDFLKKRKK